MGSIEMPIVSTFHGWMGVLRDIEGHFFGYLLRFKSEICATGIYRERQVTLSGR